MRAVQLTAYGNPVEALKYVDIPAPEAPGPNQVLIGVDFSPINPSDLLLANGLYALRPALPTVIGNEAVGGVLQLHLEGANGHFCRGPFRPASRRGASAIGDADHQSPDRRAAAQRVCQSETGRGGGG